MRFAMNNNNQNKSEIVVVLGASPNPERYSNMAVRSLKDHGHQIIPVHLKAKEIEGIKAVEDISQITEKVDTLTVYLAPEHLVSLENKIVDLNPARIIFNPGSENKELMKSLQEKGFKVIEACTLVLLKTGQF
jgi:hypothetical protein